MRRLIGPFLMLAVLALACLLFIAAGVAFAQPQIFCHRGYHKVVRHHHQVCVQDKR